MANVKLTVLVGCNYPPDDTRAEAGDVIEVDDKIAKELLAMDAAEPYKAPKDVKPTSTPTSAPLQAETGTGG